MRWLALAAAIGVIVAVGYGMTMLGGQPGGDGAAGALPHQVSVEVPTLTASAQAGEQVFRKNCVVCHGANASGGPGGPPLVHIIYEPSHHGDGSFVAAVRAGVRQHHWQFGNMPAVPGVSDEEILQIIAYVRELQRANGIR
jgi:mono/diheme cytochrome c family protein